MEKRGAVILPVFAAMLGVLLAATGGTFAASGHTPRNILPVEIFVAADPGLDSGCQAVLEASDKLFTVPFHLYSTQASDGVHNGQPLSTETIFAGGAHYILLNGKWQSSPVTSEQMKALEERNRKNATNVSCHYLHDDSVNGESVAIYTMHSETQYSKNNDQVWISKSKGVILRHEIDMISSRNNGKTHISSRYEYGNVEAPKL